MERREECLGDGVEEAVGLGSADPALHSPVDVVLSGALSPRERSPEGLWSEISAIPSG